MSDRQRIVILGAGPAGLGAAYRLTQRDLADVTVLERHNRVGGNAGSFELAGMSVDFGSHRLHPACDPEVMADIRGLLGDDLLDRPRHGRIRLRGRWIHFPLKPVDLALRLPPSFALGIAGDTLTKVLRPAPSANGEGATFASVLEAGLGRTICRDFYFPYARKLWGAEPEELSAIQARRRVSAGSLGKMIRKVLAAVPGLQSGSKGRFFYPRGGFGQIVEVYGAAAKAGGADLRLGATVQAVRQQPDRSFVVEYEQDGRREQVAAQRVWSTIPISALARGLAPAPPDEFVAAAGKIDFRAMILTYLVLEQEQFTEYDAHYFPELEIPISRLSEPRNYATRREPAGRTVLCAELPCAPEDAVWKQSDAELGKLVSQALATAGIPLQAPVLQVATRRLRQAYPIYRQGYEKHFARLDAWIGEMENLLSFGRQGLFAHDNTHHALYMAYAAVDCLDADGNFDTGRWQTYRREFEQHVVED